MELPKLSISAGVELAELEDKSVFVAQGDYHESVVVQDVSLFGGYDSTNWQRDISEYSTIIIATETFGMEIHANNVIHLVFEGFIVYGGELSDDDLFRSSCGIDFGSGSFILSKNIVYGGRAEERSGGVISFSQSSVQIYNSTIFGSSLNSESDLDDLPYPQETVGVDMSDRSFYTIINSIIHGGYSISGILSNGISLQGGGLLAINSYIYGGYPMENGSRSNGIIGTGQERSPIFDIILINNIIDGGSGLRKSIDVVYSIVEHVMFRNNNFWGAYHDCIYQYGVLSFTCLQTITEFNELFSEEFSVGGNNISQDPLFIVHDSDWHLGPESPCLDAGVDAWVNWPDLYGDYFGDFEYLCETYHLDDVLKYDFDGEQRSNGFGWDIGPDELWPEESTDDDIDDDDAPGGFSCDGGICTDLSSGLSWQNGDEMNLRWSLAINYCEDLTWGGYDDWRLPTISELRSLIRGCPETEAGGTCGVTDDCLDSDCRSDWCDGCRSDFGPGPEGEYWPEQLETGKGWWYWSSSEASAVNHAWGILFDSGNVFSGHQIYFDCRARCVRDAN